MVKLKKYRPIIQHFVIFLTFLTLFACSGNKFFVKKVEAKQFNINTKQAETAAIEDYIKPYREKVDKDMNTTLAVASQNFDKSGQWQSPMGMLLADATLLKGNLIFEKRNQKKIDICLLNHGGIRANINKGDVTTRTAFEVMPFENSLIIVALKGEQVLEIANYIIKEKKPQPLAGMTFTISTSNEAKNIKVQQQPLDLNKTYYVATSDYLSGGGDKMDFFKKGTEFFDMDYKLRNVLIDFFKDVDVLPIATDTRISVEK
jgi:2',3'-cyclic-nucleotide 2'-phosphodiesterase (5'-nucleotidase family)